MSPKDEFDPVENFRMPLMAHLHELRRRLVISLVAVVSAICVAAFFADRFWKFLAAPMNEALKEHGGTLAQIDPLEGMTNWMYVSCLVGVLAACPIVIYQGWQFIAPGLYGKEKRTIVPVAAASSLLFWLGVAFGYYVIFRFAFPFFLQVTSQDVQAIISINAYLDVAIKLLVAFGIAFQLPIVVYVLARIGLINHRDMIDGFRYSIVAIFVVAAVLTPPDVLSQCLMAAPLVVLYIIGIGVAWMFSTKKVSKPDTAA